MSKLPAAKSPAACAPRAPLRPVLTLIAAALLTAACVRIAPQPEPAKPEASPQQVGSRESRQERRDEERERKLEADRLAAGSDLDDSAPPPPHPLRSIAPPPVPMPSEPATVTEATVAGAGLGRMAAPQPGTTMAFDGRGVSPPPPVVDTENYDHFADNPVHAAATDPVSTFSIDVDTGSYANLRRFLENGQLPPQDAVRVEEMLNYFDYAYAGPTGARPDVPFRIDTEMAPNPWNRDTHLLRVGVQGWMPQGELPASNLVFLVDVSGSMQDGDKLPLVKSMLRMMVKDLRPQDHVSMVVYAGSEGVVLEPTAGSERERILRAIDGLDAGGSTNGGAGIKLAYRMAREGFIRGGINRILLATDGDFNVGTTDFDALKDLVERERAGGVALSTLGFGEGNYNDHLMEQLADAGNGNYSYIDSLTEAHKVLVLQRAGTLATIAKDVKIQVEFNPAVVAEYRLIGYENRKLAREDFDNDTVDAGEIGAGHSVTALYEVALVGSAGARLGDLRYGTTPAPTPRADEIAFLRLRYKAPDGDESRLIERPLRRADIVPSIERASEATRWAASVAAFGQLLRGGKYLEGFGYDQVERLAQSAHSHDPHGHRGEMLRLLELAHTLTPAAPQSDAEPARISRGS